MKTYLLSSDKWGGEVELHYSDDGFLIDYDNRSEMTADQKRLFNSRLPTDLTKLKELTETTNAKAVFVPEQEITFDVFWNKYNDKTRSSRKKTLKKWQNMLKKEQVRAFNYIGFYLANIPQGIAKKYASTYLNDELWNN